MKTTGIIAEYNPFHKGHQYHIQETRKQTGCDYIVALISGDFVQRGAPAVFDKHLRTRMALLGGADLVLEMPSPFSFGSAEDFASCGVALLSALGCVDMISFGSEYGQTEPLLQAADLLARETDEMSQVIQEAMKQGLSYPAARSLAIRKVCPQLPENILSSPNNILGVEYLKAIKKQKSSILPFTLQRAGSGYHEGNLNHELASATAIRKELEKAGQKHDLSLSSLRPFLPEDVFPLLQSGHPVCQKDFSHILNYTLLQNQRNLEDFYGWSEELANRMRQNLLHFGDFESRIFQLKTKQYTYTRISRCLYYLIFQITWQDMENYRRLSYAPYARVLGFKKSAAPLLAAVKEKSSIPLITKIGKSEILLNEQEKALFARDLQAAHLYNSVVSAKYNISVKNEYSQPVVII